MSNEQPLRVKFVYFLLAIILFIYAITAAKDFLYPIALAILISYLLYPLANYLEKHKFPRIMTIIISILFAIIIISVAAFFIYKRIEVMVGDFPTLKKQALKNIDTLQSSIESLFNISDNTIEQFLKIRIVSFFEEGGNFFNKLFTATAGTIFKIGILPVYVFLFLFYRTKFAHFILMMVSNDKRLITVKILRDISQIAAKYMGGVLTVVLILCFVNSAGLLLIGLKYAIVLGIISAIFTFIPYFGTIIGGTMTFAFALLTADSPTYALKVMALYIIVIFLEHNILTPNIVGGNVRVNPFIIILSLIIAAIVWGIPGMIIIVPFIAILKILTLNLPGLRPYSFLLGIRGARRHAIYIPTIKELLSRKKKEMDDND